MTTFLNKRAAATIAALGLAAASHAQTQSLEIYGVVDAAIEHVSSPNVKVTRMNNLSGSVPTRLGFRGTEDLGGGLRAFFTLEEGFGIDNGSLNQGGRAFGRQSLVGLGGPWGSVSLGRQYTMLFWSLTESDILGPSTFGSGSLDSYLPNARADNSIAYRGTFSGVTVGATYSLGRDVANASSPSGTNCAGESGTDKSACREWSAVLKYDSASWGVAAAVDTIRGGAGAFAGLTSSAMKDTRSTLNGYYKSGPFKLGGGLIRRDNDASVATPKSDLWFLGAAYAVSPTFTVDGEFFSLKFKNSANKTELYALRGTYGFSKRTAVYAMVGRARNHGAAAIPVSNGAAGSNPGPGQGQSGIAFGLRHSF